MLKVVGDSMIDAAICDGDWVVVRQQNTADNGDIVAALLDDEATVKTFKRRDGHVWLMPHNPAYAPILGDQAIDHGQGGHGPAPRLGIRRGRLGDAHRPRRPRSHRSGRCVHAGGLLTGRGADARSAVGVH